MKPIRRRWDAMLEHIEAHPVIQDVVISGGDSYYLQPDHLTYIGERLLAMHNVKRFRFATKGLAVCPSRVLDEADDWTRSLVELSEKGRALGKQVAVHTHFNHPSEITWVTNAAARHLFKHGVVVRNQTVLLRGVNDNLNTMSTLTLLRLPERHGERRRRPSKTTTNDLGAREEYSRHNRGFHDAYVRRGSAWWRRQKTSQQLRHL